MNYYQNQTVMSNFIYCVVEDGKIYKSDYSSGTKTEIGVTSEVYNEQSKDLDAYYNKLVELGIIEKEKTQEEKEEEQRQLMKSMLDQMSMLQNEIKELKSNAKHDVENINKPSGKKNGS